MRLHRSDDYQADLIGIVEHIAQDNPAAALAMWDTIEGQVERLADHPRSGRTGRVPETRELRVAGAPHVVIYRIGHAVELLRVLHGARQWPPRSP
ncbi:type II toxin-antitoxin system RelE/ParE family toxin [Inquilinus sp. OTU3971]|uniref:type II toxin-antitoxin system RelE/ParE family toxin n=1 Tax=Inquilinus sp. OTU3971 TaxID=3043855 RepID=UPI00313AE3D4